MGVIDKLSVFVQIMEQATTDDGLFYSCMYAPHSPTNLKHWGPVMRKTSVNLVIIGSGYGLLPVSH